MAITLKRTAASIINVHLQAFQQQRRVQHLLQQIQQLLQQHSSSKLSSEVTVIVVVDDGNAGVERCGELSASSSTLAAYPAPLSAIALVSCSTTITGRPSLL